MRMTKQRIAIMSALEANHAPQSAEMIFEQLPQGTMNLSTIYRTLETFFEAGLVSKSHMNSMSYYFKNRKDHQHYIICSSCQKTLTIKCNLDQRVHEIAETSGFHITHHDMTIYGVCKKCQRKPINH